MAWVAVIGAGGAIAGGLIAKSGGSSQSGTQTVTNKAEMDPRISSMLFGADGNKGLLSQYQGMLGAPQNDAMKQYGTDAQQFLGANSAGMTSDMHQVANNLMGGNVTAPAMGHVEAAGAQVNAPAQNGMDLSGSYDRFINGAPGANPYLTGAIGKGINQSNNAFGAMQRDSTKNLLENIMPSIRSNSVLSGQYGGSRQGIAEGRALDAFSTEQQRAMSQVGQNNTDAAVAAQAGAYDADSNRALGATQGLGAQQYGVASQNATLGQQNNQFNAGLTQDQFKTNVGATLSTDQLNTGRQTAGIAANSGLLGGAYAAGQNQDSYALNQAGKVNGLLAPYLGQVPGSSTSSQPLYQNTAGNMIGGATAGTALGKQFGGLLSGWGSGNNPGAGANGFVDWSKG